MSSHLENKSFVGNALRKYDDWQISILHACKTRDVAKTVEIEEIRNHNSVAPNGYNLTRGGEGSEGYHHTEESKEKNRQASLGNRNARGYKHTEEAIEKIRQAARGRRDSKETRRKRSESKVGNQNAKGTHKSFSKETNRRRSASLQGRKNTKKQMLNWHVSILRNKLKRLENGQD